MRKKQAAPAPRDDDPFPYTGPIQRADGTRPYNRYLWPTESWWAHRMMPNRRHLDSRWNFGIVALWDETFATDGFIGQIEKNSTDPFGKRGRPVVFPTRAGAIRASAARLIQQARNSRHWKSIGLGALSRDEERQEVIDWIRAVVARETAAQPPKPIAVLPTPKPPPPKTGLPLFDL